MLFHSQIFILFFLPLVMLAAIALANRPAPRQWVLIAFSLVFYAWWDVRFLPLILAQALLSWAISELHFKTGARWPVRLAIIANLSVLGLYKYLDFFVTIAEDLSGATLPRSNLILPIGISFYTFQIVSYLLDVLRNDAPRYALRRFALFVVLFPQLVAGPIVRHNEIISQFDANPFREGWQERVSRGLTLFIAAAAIKVLVADKLAVKVDPVFALAQTEVPSFSSALLGTLGFSLQIFFDFAAYSEMAIGLALMLGLVLPQNFAQPFRAASLRDFWRRWHMTLSRFLRDYLYIPLGGSREGARRFVVAALTTMGLCGLWHGAGWNFILWGVMHGVGLIVCRFWSQRRLPMPTSLGWLITFVFVVLLFVWFRAPDMATGFRVFEGLLMFAGPGAAWDVATTFLIVAAASLALAPITLQEAVERWLTPDRRFAAAMAVLAVFIVLEVGKGQPKSFIYFQF